LCARRELELQSLAGSISAEEQQLLLELFNSGKLSTSFRADG
jgi:hypothetical protein